ncbi:hypothetical protein APUTEX25_001033 [Auxenochlorella protothecoides]|uniref:S-acyltransferase n=1 Tax=Auxenochlorella protothecoides TaxID=3075 RepID=A0A3M7KST3_AUXPR|nr:hypothetical protein APUTEX25_001033 [Auxenochlorella protothecoides]|eukprot:RMZ52914.1 hypothetical protein APUTEX25_001033 [Auxenochlorella protothecoides]
MANWDVTKLDVFKYLRCLRHLGKAMLLVVFALAWLEVQAVFSCSLAPAWRQGGLIMRALVGITGAVFLAMVALLLWAYLATFAANPGLVPPGWQPFELDEQEQQVGSADLQALADDFTELIRDSEDPVQWHLLRPRFCKKCAAWKPPRAHHCRMTQRCVLKMDHWCVWVLNCVGLFNYKFFVLFLGYTDVACWISVILLLGPTLRQFRGTAGPLSTLLLAFTAFVFAAAFSLALLAFLIMHLRLIARNQTTIEAFEKAPVKPWPYDQGWRRNFLEVFGRQRQYWLLPLHPAADAEAMRRAYLEWTLPWPIDSGQLDDHAGLEMSQSY